MLELFVVVVLALVVGVDDDDVFQPCPGTNSFTLAAFNSESIDPERSLFVCKTDDEDEDMDNDEDDTIPAPPPDDDGVHSLAEVDKRPNPSVR